MIKGYDFEHFDGCTVSNLTLLELFHILFIYLINLHLKYE